MVDRMTQGILLWAYIIMQHTSYTPPHSLAGMQGIGCRVIAHDLQPNPACVSQGITYCDSLEEMLPQVRLAG